MGKIKLAYFIDSYKPGAGTENQLKGLLQHLDQEQVEARLFTLRDEVLPEHKAEIPWPVETLHIPRMASFATCMKIFKFARRLRREKYDIVSIYFNDSNLFVLPACRLAGIKNIIINRRSMGYIHIPGILKRINHLNRSKVWILANSEAVKAQVVESEKFPADRIKVIYNGLWDQDANMPGPVSRESLGLSGHCHVVGIVANLRPIKRIDRFIEMAAIILSKFGSARFIILGQGPLKDSLIDQAAGLGLQEKIIFLGHKPDVRPYLSLLDVGVLTSESEGLSNTLIEYLRHGVPVVTFDVGGNREVIEDGIGGYLVPQSDVVALADKVVELLTDNEHRRRFAEAGRRYVDENFAPDKVIREMMAFYRMILET